MEFNGLTVGVVEDDEKLCGELVYFLNSNGYEAFAVQGRDYNAEKLAGMGCQLLLLDIGLPDADGLFLCREIRRRSEVPIIILTSRDNEITELMSMNSGADDFVAKPVNPQILLARMEAILKRVYFRGKTGNKLSLGGFTLDLAKGEISGKERAAELTKNELKILTVLAARRGEIVSREDLMNGLWENHMFVDDNTLTVNISRLKAKLEEIGVKDVIVTKRGMGYQLL